MSELALPEVDPGYTTLWLLNQISPIEPRPVVDVPLGSRLLVERLAAHPNPGYGYRFNQVWFQVDQVRSQDGCGDTDTAALREMIFGDVAPTESRQEKLDGPFNL